MLFDVYNPYPNQDVTSEYVSVIAEALVSIGYDTRKVDTLAENVSREADGVVVIMPYDAYRAKKAGYKSVILWTQGIVPEESFMRHHSYPRFWVLSIRERIGILNADFVLMCSNAMREHFIKKYRLKLPNSYIMPCFNNEIEPTCFDTEGKFTKNTFIYAGSVAPWQCFEQTIRMYKLIEDRVDNAFLRVLVREHDYARTVIENYNVKNYSLDFVPQSEIGKEMERAKFGFCLRGNTVVNNVATPTKLSTYVSHGVMPIYTDALVDFHKIAKNNEYCFCVNMESDEDVNKLIEACNRKVNSFDVLAQYQALFGNYFSKSFHLEMLRPFFNKMFAPKNQLGMCE